MSGSINSAFADAVEGVELGDKKASSHTALRALLVQGNWGICCLVLRQREGLCKTQDVPRFQGRLSI